ncbi:hypothetical protein HDU88_001132 [Geranomyces variabilis]|nr:hypothetical protein HDU88_001132 [Geranomyces variabilis]
MTSATASPTHQAFSNRDDSLSYDIGSRSEHLRTLSQGLFDDLSRDLEAIGHASADVGRVRAQLGRLEDYLDDTIPTHDDQNVSTDDDDSPLINPIDRARNHSGVDAPSHVLRAGLMAADQSEVAAANGGLTNFSLSFDIYEDEPHEGSQGAPNTRPIYGAKDASNRQADNSSFRFIQGIEDFDSNAGLDDPSLQPFDFGSARAEFEQEESSRFGASVFAGLDSLINREEQQNNGDGWRQSRSGLRDTDKRAEDSASYGYPTTRASEGSTHNAPAHYAVDESFHLGGESVGSSPVLPSEPGYKSIMDESDVDDQFLPEITERATTPRAAARNSSRLSSPRNDANTAFEIGSRETNELPNDSSYNPDSSIAWRDRERIKVADDDREARYRRSFKESLDNVEYNIDANGSRSEFPLSDLGRPTEDRLEDHASLLHESASRSPVRTKRRATAPLLAFRNTPTSRSRSPDRSQRYQQPLTTGGATDSATWRPPSRSSIDFGDIIAQGSRSIAQPEPSTLSESRPDSPKRPAAGHRLATAEIGDQTPPSASSIDLRDPGEAVKTNPGMSEDRGRRSLLPVPSNSLSAGRTRTSNQDPKSAQPDTSGVQSSAQKESVLALRVMQDKIGRLESEKAVAKNRIRGLELELGHTRSVALYEQNDVRVTGPRGRSLSRHSSRERSRSRSRGGAEMGGRRGRSRGRSTRTDRDAIAEEEAVQIDVDKALRDKVERENRTSAPAAAAPTAAPAPPKVPTPPPAAAPAKTASTGTKQAEPIRSNDDSATAAALESWRSRSRALEQQLNETRTEKERILMRLEETRAQVDMLRQQVVMSEIEAERRRQRQTPPDKSKEELEISDAALRASYTHVPEVAAPEPTIKNKARVTPPPLRDGSVLGREDVQALREEIEGQRSIRKKVAIGGHTSADPGAKKPALHKSKTKNADGSASGELSKKDRLRRLVVTRLLEESGQRTGKADDGNFTVTKEGQRPEWKRVQPPLPTSDKAAQRAVPASADEQARNPLKTNVTSRTSGVNTVTGDQLRSSQSKRNAKTQTAGGKIIITGSSGRPAEAAPKHNGTSGDARNRQATVQAHDRSHPRPALAATRELPFTVGRSTQKSHSVTANLQQVFSLLKSHNPRRCSVCVPREYPAENTLQPRPRHTAARRDLPDAGQRRRQARKSGRNNNDTDDDDDDHASFHGTPLHDAAAYAAAHFGLNKRAAGDRDSVGRKSSTRDSVTRQDRGVETLAAVLKLLEGEYDELKRNYNTLVAQYGAASGIARKPSARNTGADIRALGDDLRMVIRSMDAKGDQIAILRDILKGFGAMVGRSRPVNGSRIHAMS